MNKYFILLYSGLCYTLGMLSVMAYSLYLADLLPYDGISLNFGSSVTEALAINSFLLGLFSVQHSGMARREFKAWLTQWVPEAAERSTYVLFSGLMLCLFILFWQPFPITLYDVRGTFLSIGLQILYWLGWGLLLLSTFQIDHLHLFGLKQAWFNFKKQPTVNGDFKVPFLYRLVRHPLYLSILIFHWSTPHLTAERLMLALGMMIYIYVGIEYEEEDLVQEFGTKYSRYAQQVPKLFPTVSRPKKQLKNS